MFSSSSPRAVARFLCLSIVVGLSIVVPAPAALAQQQSEEMQIVAAAEQMVNQGQPDQALAELQKLLAENGEFAPAYFVTALAYKAKGDAPKAYENMVKAAEYNPGWGQAHRQASRYAADMGNLDASWDQAIMAHQAGTDMSDAFEGLQTMGPAPDDLDAQLAAYRVFVAGLDLENFLRAAENPFGRTADASNTSNDPSNRTSTKATSVGARVASDSQSDRNAVARLLRSRLADSPYFGLVGRQDMAQYILIIKVDEIGEEMDDRPLEGVLYLLDSQSGEEAFRRRIQMDNIVSLSSINRNLDRIVGNMEEWAEERQR